MNINSLQSAGHIQDSHLMDEGGTISQWLPLLIYYSYHYVSASVTTLENCEFHEF
uniref:Uncharacterized protein n=1 Tax=Arundo donax TaxID=35708 RepID=A0A0A8YXC2_ARUDO